MNSLNSERFFITGGTGLIGYALQQALSQRGIEGTVLTRSPSQARSRLAPGFASLQGDITEKNWLGNVENHDVIVHLAGFPLFQKRWSDQTKALIHRSRILGTQNLLEAVQNIPTNKRPKKIISASAIGYYGITSGDQVLNESSPHGEDFLSQVALEWEQESSKLSALTQQLTIFRIGIVLSMDGGMLARVVPIFRSGLGGRLSDGKQWISWIHIQDVIVGILEASLAHHWKPGTYNLTAPHPITNREFTKIVGKILKRPSFIPTPQIVLQKILGEGSKYVVTGQRVLPQKLLDQNWKFEFPYPDSALKDLLCQRK